MEKSVDQATRHGQDVHEGNLGEEMNFYAILKIRQSIFTSFSTAIELLLGQISVREYEHSAYEVCKLDCHGRCRFWWRR